MPTPEDFAFLKKLLMNIGVRASEKDAIAQIERIQRLSSWIDEQPGMKDNGQRHI